MSADRARMLLALTAIVIIGREIAISALREWMAELGQRAKVAVSVIGKFKTILQIIGLSMMLFRWDLLGLPIFSIGFLFTVVAAAFTLVSTFSYLRGCRPELKRHEEALNRRGLGAGAAFAPSARRPPGPNENARIETDPGVTNCLNLERETRLELATPTLARSCSTN